MSTDVPVARIDYAENVKAFIADVARIQATADLDQFREAVEALHNLVRPYMTAQDAKEWQNRQHRAILCTKAAPGARKVGGNDAGFLGDAWWLPHPEGPDRQDVSEWFGMLTTMLGKRGLLFRVKRDAEVPEESLAVILSRIRQNGNGTTV